MATEVERIIKLTRGVPPDEALPCELVGQCCAQALADHGEVLLQYNPATGFAPLRALLAEQAGVSSEALLLGNGSIQLLFFLARVALSEGETVVTERPTYDRALTAFRTLRLNVVGVPMEDDGLEVDALSEVIERHRPRLLYTVPDFQNPTGITTSLAKREAVVELARRHDVLIVEDIPYRLLRYKGTDVPSYRMLAPDHTVQLSSFSKLLAPGLRVGWALGDPDLVAKMAKVAEDAYITPGLLGQGVVYEFLRCGHLEPNLQSLKALYRPRLEALLSGLEQAFPEGSWARPQGGFFVGMTLPPGADVHDVARVAREKYGLVVSDSAGFFPDGDPSRFVRLPFCALNEGEIGQAMERLAQAVEDSRSGGR